MCHHSKSHHPYFECTKAENRKILSSKMSAATKSESTIELPMTCPPRHMRLAAMQVRSMQTFEELPNEHREYVEVQLPRKTQIFSLHQPAKNKLFSEDILVEMNGKHNNSQRGAQSCSTNIDPESFSHRIIAPSQSKSKSRSAKPISQSGNAKSERHASECRETKAHWRLPLLLLLQLLPVRVAPHTYPAGNTTTPKVNLSNTTHFHPSYTQRLSSNQGMYPDHINECWIIIIKHFNRCPSSSFAENHCMRKEYGSLGNGQSNVTQLYAIERI